MKNVFVQTTNVLRFNEALSALNKRGASEACLVVIDGEPGLGKTTTLARHAAQQQAVYLRAKKKTSHSWLLNELLGVLRQDPPHATEKKFGLALQTLAQRQQAAAVKGEAFSLIIDEADHISGNGDVIETIRDLSDMLELPTILVGMGKIRNNLKRFPQVMSRISQYVKFEPADFGDARLFFDSKCEVAVADDLVNFIQVVSGGFNREILEAMAIVERFGRRNQPSDGIALTLADMAGQRVMNDRKSGQPIHVPEVQLKVAE